MKKLLTLFTLVLAVTVCAQTFPIKNGKLQSTLDANGQIINNGIFVGDGSGLINIPGVNDVTQAGLAEGSYPISDLSIVESQGVSQHVKGLDAYNLWSTVASNKQVRFAIVGDSVASAVETTRGVRLAFEAKMARGGWGSQYTENPIGLPSGSLKFYMSGHTVNPATGPSLFYGMANGQVSTSVFDETAPLADKVSIYYHADSAFGTLLVETNAGAGWGTRATINAAEGSFIFRATNYTLAPLANYSLRITSTGTNVFDDAALIDSRDNTNSVVFSRQMCIPGGTLEQIVTHPGFYVWLTNYNPQVLFFEAKDPVNSLMNAATWIRDNLTNRDCIFIASSPNLPDAGMLTSRLALIDFCKTNSLMCFDKYALFLPTNKWYAAMSYSAENIWTDGAHLGKLGIRYATSAFTDWLGCGDHRFLFSIAAQSIAGKANLVGGNTFSGDNYFANLYVGSGNTVLSSTGSQSGFNYAHRDDQANYGRLYANAGTVYLMSTHWPGTSGLIASNASGKFTYYVDPAVNWTLDTPRLGVPSSPWWLHATNSYLYGVSHMQNVDRSKIISPVVNGVTLWVSNSHLWSIHNLAGVFTTNLIKAP